MLQYARSHLGNLPSSPPRSDLTPSSTLLAQFSLPRYGRLLDLSWTVSIHSVFLVVRVAYTRTDCESALPVQS